MKNSFTKGSTQLPVYIQLSELIQREIMAGLYVQGDRLPPESVLAAQLGVAVGTLRKALSELDSRGMLERIQGSGTYVRRNTKDTPVGKSVYEFLRLELPAGGGLPTAQTLALDKVQTPVAFRNSFPAHCYRVRRLRFLNRTPVAVEEIYFEASSHPRLSASDLGEALYVFYKERLGFWIASAEDRIGLGQAPAWTPSALNLSVGAVCPRIERVARDSEGTIREYSITWFDAQQCRYVHRMR